MIENYCCFTGLRPQKLNFEEGSQTYDKIMEKCENYIIQLIEKYGVTHFVSGMALGWDTWCAREVLELKQKYNIKLECVIPCSNQDKLWNATDKKRYRTILKKADEVNVLQAHYSSDCMLKRNHFIVDKSLYVLALWDGQNGGTAETLAYSMKCKRQIIIINPLTCKASFFSKPVD